MDLHVSWNEPGMFDVILPSVSVAVALPDDAVPAHLAHPSIVVTLPLAERENQSGSGLRAAQVVRSMIDIEPLLAWLKEESQPDAAKAQPPAGEGA